MAGKAIRVGKRSILVAILVAAVLGTSGWLSYQHAHNARRALADSVTNTAATQTPITIASASNQPAQAATKYLVINEWGIEIPLSGDIADAYYVVPLGSQGSDGKPTEVDISLSSRGAKCGVVKADPDGQQNDLVAITRSPSGATDAYSGKPVTQLEPVGTTINGWYYGLADAYLKSKPSGCMSHGDMQSLDASFGNAVKRAVAVTANS